MGKPDNRVQIWVALISTIAVLIGSFMSNYKNIFPTPPPPRVDTLIRTTPIVDKKFNSTQNDATSPASDRVVAPHKIFASYLITDKETGDSIPDAYVEIEIPGIRNSIFPKKSDKYGKVEFLTPFNDSQKISQAHVIVRKKEYEDFDQYTNFPKHNIRLIKTPKK